MKKLTRARGWFSCRGLCLGWTLPALLLGLGSPALATTLGATAPASLSLCESATDASGLPRPECQGGDIRFQAAAGSPASLFGWSVATGDLNGDGLADLVVGDPGRNRVYVFLGRVSAKDGYGLDPASLSARMVSPDTQADVIFTREPLYPGQVGSFGFSVAVGRQPVADACSPGVSASALVIGAPGHPGTTGNPAGTAYYIPAGALCLTPANPASPVTYDPVDIGQAIQSPSAADDDEFGYSVALSRVLVNTGTEEDVVVGARGALSGAGRVSAFPVTNHVVATGIAQVVRIEGTGTDGLGEVVAVGDLDLDYDATLDPNGGEDDLAIGAVGSGSGKVLLIQGPLSPSGGRDADGIYREGVDIQIKRIEGEATGDFFGFSASISAQGQLAVGAIFADNDPPPASGSTSGGDPKTNVDSGKRINGGKAYVWNNRVFTNLGAEAQANSADVVLVARRSGDQLGFGVAFGDLDGSGSDDLIVTARREDGPGLTLNQIDQGTAYLVLDQTSLTSPVDLNKCAINSDCTGVSGIDVMLFGGDRENDLGDEVGYAVATGDFNGDQSADLFLSSITHQRVYVATIQDSDDDRLTQGRNIRDDDDDNDSDPDATDCAPEDPQIHTGADEILCNNVDENCNGMADDAPDSDGDGYDACAPGTDAGDKDGKAKDCDDSDPNTYPSAPELCDGNNNACTGAVPTTERDLDSDGYVSCTGWADTQGDNPDIVGGGDCDDRSGDTFPGSAPNDSATGCMKDSDGDDFGDASPPTGVTPGTDCDDRPVLGAATFPGSAEKEDASACMKDTDGDGYGDATVALPIVRGSDCNDADVQSYPGAPELCDGNDNACAGTVPVDETDPDGDKYVQCSPWADVQGDNANILGGGDCDPADGKTFPGAGRNEVFNTACMTDQDGDGYGEINPPAGITPGTDCDDTSASAAVTFPGAAQIEGPLNCMKDADDDGYGDASAALPVAAGTDCDDAEAAIHPGDGAQNPPAAEIPDDGIDQDCNGYDQVTCYADQDHDGYGAGAPILNDFGACPAPDYSSFDTDCNDADPAINPGAAEIPGDGIDQDCNGSDAILCVLDADMDGHGTVAGTEVLAGDGTCDAAQQEAVSADDCDDQDPATYPGAPELCDGNDNTCSGTVPADEQDPDGDHFVACTGWADTQGDNPDILGGGDCDPADADTFPGAAPNEVFASACMRDKDGDDYGDLNPPAGVTRGTDCDDSSPAGPYTFPGAAQIEAPLNCMKDEDDDGYGDASVAFPVVKGTDCDDSNPDTHPGAAELCDGLNNSCAATLPAEETDPDGDGYVACSPWVGTTPGILGGGDCDPADADTFPGAAPNEAVPTACMRDKDGDDYGDLTPPAGVTPGTDCDDTSPAAAFTYPGAAELEVGGSQVCMRDQDNDGWGDSTAVLPVVAGSDCADTDAGTYPGAPELCDGINNGCTGPVPADEQDPDADGYVACGPWVGTVSGILGGGDCAPSDPASYPGAPELCDGNDNACAGSVPVDEQDPDGDHYVACAGWSDSQGDNPTILGGDDCAPLDASTYPGAPELCDGINNACTGAVPANEQDSDGDGYVACGPWVGTVSGVLGGGDCDPADADTFPGAAPVDSATACMRDKDNDDYGDVSPPAGVTPGTDCNDGDASINPGAVDICGDGIDSNCDGQDPVCPPIAGGASGGSKGGAGGKSKGGNGSNSTTKPAPKKRD